MAASQLIGSHVCRGGRGGGVAALRRVLVGVGQWCPGLVQVPGEVARLGDREIVLGGRALEYALDQEGELRKSIECSAAHVRTERRPVRIVVLAVAEMPSLVTEITAATIAVKATMMPLTNVE